VLFRASIEFQVNQRIKRARSRTVRATREINDQKIAEGLAISD
jgi:hypothetical protein